MRRIILASASPRRRELLERAGVKFEVIPASGDENRTSDDPKEAVAQLARDKAVSVKATVEDAEEGTVIIGSDTVVVFQNIILGKHPSGIHWRFCIGEKDWAMAGTCLL